MKERRYIVIPKYNQDGALIDIDFKLEKVKINTQYIIVSPKLYEIIKKENTNA